MAVVKESITNGIREGRLPDRLMPVRRGQLAGDDRRAGAVPVLQDLQGIAAFGLLQGDLSPIMRNCTKNGHEKRTAFDIGTDTIYRNPFSAFPSATRAFLVPASYAPPR